MMKKYMWHGFPIKIADEDLKHYPGAVLIETLEKKQKKAARPDKAELEAAVKSKEEPKNKKRTASNKKRSVSNKSKE